MSGKEKIRESLLDKFNFIANEYIKKFVKKHGYEFSYWISDEPGTTACFIEQYYFSYDDIRYDIDKDLPKDLIFSWHDDSLEQYFNEKSEKYMNLKSYASGLRYKDLK